MTSFPDGTSLCIAASSVVKRLPLRGSLVEHNGSRFTCPAAYKIRTSFTSDLFKLIQLLLFRLTIYCYI